MRFSVIDEPFYSNNASQKKGLIHLSQIYSLTNFFTTTALSVFTFTK
jgi:hypothetical protein